MKLSELKHQPNYKLFSKKEFNTIKARRAELLVELFLEELNPLYLAKVNSEEKRELPFDYLVFLKKGIALLAFGVLIKAYNEKSELLKSVQISADEYAQLIGSNLPILIVAVDVKKNTFFPAGYLNLLLIIAHHNINGN